MGWRETSSPPSQARPSPRGWREVRPDDGGGMDAFGAFLSGTADGASMGFGDEGMGALAYLAAELQGDDGGDAFRRAVLQSRLRQDEAQSNHALAYMGGNFAGTLGSFMVPGVGWGAQGARLAKLAPKGARSFMMAPEAGWARRALGGAGAGGAFGALSGFGHGEGDAGERIDETLTGTGLGLGFGAAAPLAISATQGIGNAFRGVTRSGAAARPTGPYGPAPVAPLPMSVDDALASRTGQDAAESIDDIVGDMGRRGQGGGAAPIGLNLDDLGDEALDDFIRTMGRAGHDADSLGAYIDDAVANDPGRGRTFVEAGGPAAVNRMKFLTKAPGTTGTRAEEQFRQRGEGALTRLERDLLGPPTSTPRLSSHELEQRFPALYRTEGARLYNPLWQRKMPTGGGNVFAQRIQPLLDDEASGAGRWMRSALAKGDEMIATDRLLGTLGDDVQNLVGLRLHYAKMAIDDMIFKAKRASDSSSITGNELRQLVEVKSRLLDALDGGAGRGGIAPGYTKARREWGDIVEAEEALDYGRSLFKPNMSPEGVEEYARQLSPFQRIFFRAGMEDDIIARLASRDIEGRADIARALLDTRKARIMRAAFPSASAFERFRRALSTESFLARSGAQASPRSGSDTGIALFEGLDMIASGAKPRGPVEAGWSALGKIGDDLGARASETRNNELGDMLLQQIDDPSTAPQLKAFLQKVRERILARQQMTRDAAFGGFGGGASGAQGASFI